MIFSPVRGKGFEQLESISGSSKHTLLYSDEYQNPSSDGLPEKLISETGLACFKTGRLSLHYKGIIR